MEKKKKNYFVYRGDHTRITDMLRCAFVFDSFSDLYRGFSILEEIVSDNKKNIKGGILYVKDRFVPQSVPFGYRDLLIHFFCPESEVICEIQFHHKALYRHHQLSHDLYKKARLFKTVQQQNLLYDYVSTFVKPKTERRSEKGEENNTSSMEKLVAEWLPRCDVKQYIIKLRENGYDSVELLQYVGDKDSELIEMGFKPDDAVTFLRKKMSILNCRMRKLLMSFANVKNDSNSIPWQCVWFGKNPFRWINTDWEAATLSNEGVGVPHRLEWNNDQTHDDTIDNGVPRSFSVVFRFRVSKCKEGVHHSTLVGLEDLTFIRGDDLYEWDLVDNAFHSVALVVNFQTKSFSVMIDGRDEQKTVPFPNNFQPVHCNVLYFGCHIHRGYNNVYKRMDGEISQIRVFSIPFNSLAMQEAIHSYRRIAS
ncbi:hypothetical protein RFI_03488 [Reticulomyxa filosa]|uniref:SAM domain-containing protein n=1 Tax=Reticulomyxa filosa TaxID=46433 RepID=X6P673_RETFI|nr:hypothetical protein RFI_03488 [Reticulomyxa filosa]|eukprot:ETO33613.1 hypothetical protein RFI_03488 [Reticulomyxa filosa]